MFHLVIIILNINYGRTDGLLMNSSSLVSKPEADEYCRLIGAVLPSFFDVVTRPSVLDDVMFLNATQSVWLSDFAILSPFLSSYGCFKRADFGHKTVLKELSLYSCVEHCQNLRENNIRTVGISIDLCYCFSEPYYEFTWLALSECGVYCSNFSFERCGGSNAMSVYAFDKEFTADLRSNELSPKQCTFIMQTDRQIDLHTASCYDTDNISHTISGYFCLTWGSDKMHRDCSESAGRGSVCLVDDVTSWPQSNKDCLTGKGYMADFWSSRVQTMTKNNRRYWLGRYRTFKATHERDTNACLTITRIGENLYIETDTCHSNKSVICIEPVKTTLTADSTISAIEVSNATIPTSNKLNQGVAKLHKLNVWIVSLITSGSGVLVIFLIAVLIYAMHQRWIKFKKTDKDYYLHPRPYQPRQEQGSRYIGAANHSHENHYPDVFLQIQQPQTNHMYAQPVTNLNVPKSENKEHTKHRYENPHMYGNDVTPEPRNTELFYQVTHLQQENTPI